MNGSTVEREIRYLIGADLKVWRVEGATHPRVEILGDRVVLQARFKRVFPHSHPQEFYSLQDGANHEVGVLKNLEGLDGEARKIIEQELDRRYYTPKILRILVIKRDSGMFRFEVETDRGFATYFVRNWRDSAHEVMPGNWHILSVDGQRFEIPQLEALDRRSQNLLYQELF